MQATEWPADRLTVPRGDRQAQRIRPVGGRASAYKPRHEFIEAIQAIKGAAEAVYVLAVFQNGYPESPPEQTPRQSRRASHPWVIRV